jgi:hypothetical protein
MLSLGAWHGLIVLRCHISHFQPCVCMSTPPAPVLQPVFGFNSKDPAKFLRVAPNSELMYVQDPEVSFNQVCCCWLQVLVNAVAANCFRYWLNAASCFQVSVGCCSGQHVLTRIGGSWRRRQQQLHYRAGSVCTAVLRVTLTCTQ